MSEKTLGEVARNAWAGFERPWDGATPADQEAWTTIAAAVEREVIARLLSGTRPLTPDPYKWDAVRTHYDKTETSRTAWLRGELDATRAALAARDAELAEERDAAIARAERAEERARSAEAVTDGLCEAHPLSNEMDLGSVMLQLGLYKERAETAERERDKAEALGVLKDDLADARARVAALEAELSALTSAHAELVARWERLQDALHETAEGCPVCGAWHSAGKRACASLDAVTRATALRETRLEMLAARQAGADQRASWQREIVADLIAAAEKVVRDERSTHRFQCLDCGAGGDAPEPCQGDRG